MTENFMENVTRCTCPLSGTFVVLLAKRTFHVSNIWTLCLVLNDIWLLMLIFFWKHVFSRFVTSGMQKCEKSLGLLSFFLQNQFLFCKRWFDRFCWHLDQELFGMHPRSWAG